MMQIMIRGGKNWAGAATAARNRQLLVDAAGKCCANRLRRPRWTRSRAAPAGQCHAVSTLPDPEATVRSVFAEARKSWTDPRGTLQMDDPWLALVSYFEEACEFVATNQGLST